LPPGKRGTKGGTYDLYHSSPGEERGGGGKREKTKYKGGEKKENGEALYSTPKLLYAFHYAKKEGKRKNVKKKEKNESTSSLLYIVKAPQR